MRKRTAKIWLLSKEELQKIIDESNSILQMLKDSADLLIKLDEIYLWDKSRSKWIDLAHKLGETGRQARKFIGPHNLWDLTNDTARAESIKRTLRPSESPTGDFDDFDDV